MVGAIKAHEFIARDGVFEDPTWTFEFGIGPITGAAVDAITGIYQAIGSARR